MRHGCGEGLDIAKQEVRYAYVSVAEVHMSDEHNAVCVQAALCSPHILLERFMYVTACSTEPDKIVSS